MSASLRLLTIVILVSVVLAGASCVLPSELLADLGLDGADFREAVRIYWEESDRSAQLDRRDVLILSRLNGKNEIVRQLLAGKLTLWQAAARFQRLNEEPTEMKDLSYRQAFPGATAGESACRQVLHWVETELAGDQAADRAVLRRLQAELDERLRRDGTVELTEE
jgi:hypothetical protein